MPTKKTTKRTTKTSVKLTPFERIDTLKKSIVDAEKALVTAFEKAEAHAKKTLEKSHVNLTRANTKLREAREKYKGIAAQLKAKKTAALKARWEKAKTNVAEFVEQVAQLKIDHATHKQHFKTTQQGKKQHKAKQVLLAKHEADIIKAAKKSKKTKTSRARRSNPNKPTATNVATASQREKSQPTTSKTPEVK